MAGAVNSSKQRYTHTVAWRVDDAEFHMIAQLKATFPSNSWSEVFRWLIHQSEVEQVIAKRVRG
jgi:hypothetical protein